ncbi:MAG: hypothetical protein IKB64_10600 [Paludibacteraceae bacterium]|nr:hypothetical protein [Paludibacteraceae bacterium]
MKKVNEYTLEFEEVTEDLPVDVVEKTRKSIRSILNCKPEDFAAKYNAYKQAKAEFDEIYEPFKEKLIALHSESPEIPKSVVVGGVKLTYVGPSTRTSIDSKKLKEEEPELAKKFTKTSNVNASVRIEGI